MLSVFPNASPTSTWSMSTPPPSSNAPRPTSKQKRPKSVQACSSCRKLKTRCELLEVQDAGNVQCHRCKVLNLQCSFLEMDKPPLRSSPRNSSVPQFPPMANPSAPETQSFPTGPPLGYNGYPRIETASVQFWAPLTSNHASNFDWSAPMHAIQQLSTDVTYGQTPSIELRNALNDAIPHNMKLHLLEIFNTQFAVWLPFPIHNQSLVDIAKCSVASRHLNTPNRGAILAALRCITDRFLANVVLDIAHFETVDACQTLLILAYWAPLSSDGNGSLRDRRGVLSLATTIALNLRLDQASTSALQFPQSQNILDMGSMPTATELAGLWMSISVTDSWLCVGTGRTPSAIRSQDDMRLLLQQQGIATHFDSPETRQRLMADFFDGAERGICLQLNSLSAEDVEIWYSSVTVILESMDTLSRAVENAYQGQDEALRLVQLWYQYCRLVVLYHATFEARYICQQQGLEDASAHIRPHNKPILAIWTGDILSCAHSFLLVIDGVQTMSPPSTLSTYPDHLFSMITFVAALLLGSNIMALSSHHSTEDFDQLITSVLSQLSHCTYSLPTDHSVHKTVHLVTSMLSVWRQAQEHSQLLPHTYNNPPPHSFTQTTRHPGSIFFLDPTGLGSNSSSSESDADYFVSDLLRCRDAEYLTWTSTIANPTTMNPEQQFPTSHCFIPSY